MSDTNTGPFSNAERVDIRRFCGYPFYGPNNSSFNSWRFFQAYGLLEYKMTNMAVEEMAVVRQKLNDLYPLESAIPLAAANLDTDKAAVWTHNKTEVPERVMLFNKWRNELCGIIGIPPGPYLNSVRQRECVV